MLEYGGDKMNVNPTECKTCRFFPYQCHYHDYEGMNLSFLIANSDGTCQKRQQMEGKTENKGQDLS